MPNRRRRKLSTAMSAVAALAVASPVAVVALSDLSASTNAAPSIASSSRPRSITDLPNELIGALSQGLSQFGVNLPPLPTGLLTGSPAPRPTLAARTRHPRPDLAGPDRSGAHRRPGLTAPGLTTPA